MISRYEVWLNDEKLNSIDGRMYVSDISYNQIAPEYDEETRGKYNGSFALNRRITSNEVTVSFVLRIYGTAERQAVLQNVIRWAAKGGWLKTSDRPLQRMYVKCTRYPAVTSVMRWLDTLSVTFTSYEYPYWQSMIPTKVSLNNGESGVLFNEGVEEATVEATITAGEALTSVQMTCGDTSIALSDLSIGAGDVITVSYTDELHILEIKSGGVSLLDKRTAASSDDLIAQAGNNAVSFSASGNAVCEFAVKGVWL